MYIISTYECVYALYRETEEENYKNRFITDCRCRIFEPDMTCGAT